jgi:hypothetical protein
MITSRKFLSYFALGVIGFCILLMPRSAFAAELIFKVVPNIAAGDGATIIEARIDPQSKDLNVVEGVINFQGAIADKLSVDVETGGSVLTLWPTPPNYLPSEKNIRFTGGVPMGFDREGLLFRMRLFSSTSGSVMISWAGGSAYLNDGKGTKEGISAQPISISLTQQNTGTVSTSSPDNIPPHFDTVEIGRDPNVYDGKYFVSFHAIDDISGVARYEVKEGQSVTTVTDGVYIFRDQARQTPVTISAYDQAGNSKTIEIPSRFDWTKSAILVLLFAVILFIVLRYGYKKIIKK